MYHIHSKSYMCIIYMYIYNVYLNLHSKYYTCIVHCVWVRPREKVLLTKMTVLRETMSHESFGHAHVCTFLVGSVVNEIRLISITMWCLYTLYSEYANKNLFLYNQITQMIVFSKTIYLWIRLPRPSFLLQSFVPILS